ncbi:hypothetical protein GUITHDRAFT_116908 [Guillardia theta CCMP2712]|uniref:Potassium channel domain-containing protein n=1 Tax=Guillardia theta (strain CCMP2712) TaxID=905079 RepID=L1IM69_GUITC|nr:hypothetical protein GUITHDRAFT_116908 [Guillardia theta CCMP2712]EKX36885.1 hypothetical protein GUITHDRAFT_116908 [Guillardia theta CCMP2712]|eukprot:XP_005823865.1 hypothetical protein GUITHDRAFT_116908 [Guillardia theta CCMP2712]
MNPTPLEPGAESRRSDGTAEWNRNEGPPSSRVSRGFKRTCSSSVGQRSSLSHVQSLKQLGLKDIDLVGVSTLTQGGKKRIPISDWLALAAAIQNNTGTLADHADRGITYYKEYRKTMCRNFFFTTIFGLICAVWANEIRYGFKNSNSFQSLSLELTTMVSTAIAFYYLWQYYHAELCVMRLKGCNIAPGFSVRALKGANLWGQLIRDVLILLPQPYPFIDITFSVHDAGLNRNSVYSISVVLLSLMFLRIYFLPRYFSHCIQDIYTDDFDVFCALNKTLVNDSFLIRTTMSTGPLRNLFNSIWLIIVTMTTVGYGDVYPSTRLGRLVAISASFSALIMIAISINLVQSSLELSSRERRVITKHESRLQYKKNQRSAARLILATLRVNVERLKAARNPPQEEKVDLEDLRSEVKKQEELGSLNSARSQQSEKQSESLLGTWNPLTIVDYLLPKNPASKVVSSEKEIPGGGRGRPTKTVIYGNQLPLPVLMAEEKWHLAMRDFRQNQRDALHSEMAQECDVVTTIFEVSALLETCKLKMDNAEEMIDSTVRMLHELISLSEEEP